MRDNLCEIRNCENEFPNSKFAQYYGSYSINECPVSFISDWSDSIINEYLTLKAMSDIGGNFDISIYSAKEIEAFLTLKTEIQKIENEETEKANRELRKHGGSPRGQRR